MKTIKSIRHNLQFYPKPHIKLLAGLFALLICSQLFIHKNNAKETISLDINIATDDEPAEDFTNDIKWQWRDVKVMDGDNLSNIFKRVNISATTLHQIMENTTRAERLTKIYPGHLFRFAFDDRNQFVALQYIPSKLERIEITRSTTGGFLFEHIIKQPEVQLAYKKATIDDSLFMAGQRANITQGMIMQVANVFGGVIDFVYDPRKGDIFDVLYEEEFVDGERIGNGKVLAASYTNQGETYTAYRYESADGQIGYFNPEGFSMQKPFLRAPLDFTRISSGFNLKRNHPIHKKIRAHRGIDYAAPRGTPVFAAGDGRVYRAGFSKANGNYVFIQHGPTYMTKYLHLHKRYVKSGQRVSQRDVIGSVGSTGYATGPHLHYEFLVNGVHRNPRTIFSKLPSAKPIADEEKQRFAEQKKYLQMQYKNLQDANEMRIGSLQ